MNTQRRMKVWGALLVGAVLVVVWEVIQIGVITPAQQAIR